MKLIVIDIDGTICPEDDFTNVDKKKFDWETYYNNLVPYPEAVNKINKLFNKNVIVFHTSRRHKEDSITTILWLKKYKIKYDDIKFDKPRGDIYLDNNAKKICSSKDWKNLKV